VQLDEIQLISAELFTIYRRPLPTPDVSPLHLAPLTHRDFAAERSVRSKQTQKTFDRTFKELSNDVQFDLIQLKLTEQIEIYGLTPLKHSQIK
jgi:hypothetical protein